MRIELNPKSIDSYRTFLAVKGLPAHQFVGREARFPDEYASRLHHLPAAPAAVEHVSHPGLFDYQRDISRLAIRKRKFAVFMEPGRGKTLIDFEFAHAAQAATGGRVLIVAPLMVIPQMIDEHRRFYGADNYPERVRAADLGRWLVGDGPAFGITNYEAIRAGLTRGNLTALILSESSMLKSHYGEWGGRLIDLGRGLDWKLCETGTPAPNDRIEYANHAVFLDQFPTVNSFLAKFFVNRGETNERWELKPHALRPFYRALSHWCVFVTNPAVYGWKDNTAPLPPINTHIIDVPLTAAQQELVDRTSGALPGMGGLKPGGIGSRGKWARIGKGFAPDGTTIPSNKPGIVCDLARGHRAIVWCKYNAEQDALARLMPHAANVTGTTKEFDRAARVKAFISGLASELITKPEILGFGLNLQCARRHVFSTVQDSYEDYWQAVKRSNRTGSTEPLDVFIPVTPIERPMLDTVLAKAVRVQTDTEEQETLFKEVACVEF